MSDQLSIDEVACLCTGVPPCWICAPVESETPAERVPGEAPTKESE